MAAIVSNEIKDDFAIAFVEAAALLELREPSNRSVLHEVNTLLNCMAVLYQQGWNSATAMSLATELKDNKETFLPSVLNCAVAKEDIDVIGNAVVERMAEVGFLTPSDVQDTDLVERYVRLRTLIICGLCVPSELSISWNKKYLSRAPVIAE